jgi:hypothetical protein
MMLVAVEEPNNYSQLPSEVKPRLILRRKMQELLVRLAAYNHRGNEVVHKIRDIWPFITKTI